MKEVSLYKFSPLGNHVAEDTVIRIDLDLPEFSGHMNLKEIEGFYQNQAEMLADALLNVLPQGTIEPLTIRLLNRRVSLYRGKME